MATVVHFDGLCDPNPGGVATCAFTIDVDGVRLLEEYGLAAPSGTPLATSNVAEWTALVRALERLAELGRTQDTVVMRGDSQLVVRQMGGRYRVRKAHLRALYKRATELSRQFRELRFEWVPREQNREADALCWKARHEARR